MNYVKILLLATLFLTVGFKDVPVNERAIDATVIDQRQFQLPVLKNKKENVVLRINVRVSEKSSKMNELSILTTGTTSLKSIKSVQVYYTGADSGQTAFSGEKAILFGATNKIKKILSVKGDQVVQPGNHYFWVSYTLQPTASLQHVVAASCAKVMIDNRQKVLAKISKPIQQRIGVAVRTHGQDNVHTSRIPGLATTRKGALLAIFDARYESARDLQGHMDIGLHRSTDGGNTWNPIQIAMDMGTWGGLPEKFNGVSDACLLVDENSDAIYIAGLWMHGVINKDGVWLEGLTKESNDWNHQWRDKGSQRGYGVKESAQFLIVKSVDDGLTWSAPVNITKACKKDAWWLLAPAPGQGITMKDGTLVFPSQGRDEKGDPFSNITYSQDGGKTWKTSEPALSVAGGTTECSVVELTSGSLMLNMRANKNRGNTTANNGRAIAITENLGATWKEHASSFNALQEPTCMASLMKHNISTKPNRDILLFSNPNSNIRRENITIKVSLDEGLTWPSEYFLLLDEWQGRGYSCLTSVDRNYIGILYESSQADMVFEKVPIRGWLKNK